MLIESPRHTPQDLEAWNERARYDIASANHRRLQRLEDKAVADIHQWWTAGSQTGVCGVSWGKDSVICAHLVALSGLPIPVVWARSDRYEMPECELVRDAFLATHDCRYEERTASYAVPLRGEPGYAEQARAEAEGSADRANLINDMIPERYISGVRAAESTTRALSVSRLGTVTENTCRPIGRWSNLDVWQYLATRRLPIHPAYAMTYSGALTRDRIRVHTLRTAVGESMEKWEKDYYPDLWGVS